MSTAKKKNSNQDLGSLITRYKNNSVVNEIEKNLSKIKKSDYEISSLYLSDFYDQSCYHLDSFPALEESIKRDGFLLPLIISKGTEDGKFEIINGAKRFLFAEKLHLNFVPCVLTEIDSERKIAYIIENIVEEGGCPLIKTHCFLQLKKLGYSPETISRISGLSLSQVKNLMRLDLLSDELKKALIDGKIQYGEARAMLNLPSSTQHELMEEILEDGLSVREIESRKRAFLGKQKKRTVSLKGRTVLVKFENEDEARNYYLKFKKELEN